MSHLSACRQLSDKRKDIIKRSIDLTSTLNEMQEGSLNKTDITLEMLVLNSRDERTDLKAFESLVLKGYKYMLVLSK